MSQAPRNNPPPPRHTPDDPYNLQPVQPALERNVTAEILTISVIAAGIVLLGIAAVLWFRDNFVRQPAPPPTVAIAVVTLTPSDSDQAAATGTCTPCDTVTPTKLPSSQSDVHIPAVSSDQGNSQSPAVTTPAGTPLIPSTSTTLTPDAAQAPTSTPTETATPGPMIISLPYLSYQESPPTATPTETPLAQPTDTIPAVTAAAPTSTSASTVTPAGTQISTPRPSDQATSTPAPTGIAYIDDDMSAFMAVEGEFRVGPSGIYTVTDQLGANEEISLRGRDRPGEWVYVCCVDDDDDDDEADDLAWIRQAFVRIEGNEAEGVEEDDEDYFDRNQARWLPVTQPRTNLRPLPSPLTPAANEFILKRYTADNRGQLASLPNLVGARKPWAAEPEAGGALISPLVVANNHIYAGSADAHVYSWDRINGSQAARTQLPANVTVAPAYDDGLVYVAADNGYIYALQDPIDDEPIWSHELGGPPLTGINIFSRTLFINISGELLAIDGEDGKLVADMPAPTNPIYPTIGGQLLFVFNSNLIAYDVMTFLEEDAEDIVWELNINLADVIPVYSSPGAESQAEIFVVDVNNRIYNVNANTGAIFWNEDNEEPVISLAVNDTTLFIGGNGYIKARPRNASEEDENGELIDPVLWRTPIAGRVLDGLLVDGDRIIAFLESGNIQFIDATNGEILTTLNTNTAESTAGGAVSGDYVYMPGQDGKLYGYVQTQ